MLDIFLNIHILYLEYGVLSLFGYGVLSFTLLWSLGLEYGQYGVSKVLDTTYRGFLRVGTTFDIFQNILFPYGLNTAYWSFPNTAYWILFPSWSLFLDAGKEYVSAYQWLRMEYYNCKGVRQKDSLGIIEIKRVLKR
nr:hypothetical protein [Tanacetum cinerariifolium]